MTQTAVRSISALWLLCVLATTVWLAHERLVVVQHNWSLNDWLINYAGGFARRGAFGSFALALPIPPEWAVLSAVVLANLVFLWCIFRLMTIGAAHPILLLFLASPALVLFPILDPDGAFRKEILFYTLFALILWRVRAGRPALPFLVLLPPLILSHEAMIAFAPALLLPLAHAGVSRAGWIWIGMVALVSVLAFAASTAIDVTPQQVAAICDRIAEAPSFHATGQDCARDGAVSWLEKDTAFAWTRVQGLAATYLPQLPWALILIALPFLASARLIRAYANQRNAAFRLGLLGLALNLSLWLPLFAVATDWGRLLSMQMTVLWLQVLFMASWVAEDRMRKPRLIAILTIAALYGSTWQLIHWNMLLAPGIVLRTFGLADAG